MTTEIALTLAILVIAVILLIFDRLRADLIALLVLLALALSRLVSPSEALSGFSNPAVVTVWAMFILGEGLARTGVANIFGRRILRISGKGEAGFMAVMMFLVAGLSSFMNSTAIVVMFLPVISFVAKAKKLQASKLLIPLAFGTLLGGVNTLISTPPNILVSNALQDFQGQQFQFFDFLKAGLPVTLGGIAFMVVLGRRLLPNRDLTGELRKMQQETGKLFDLEERLFALRLPKDSLLAGKRLADSRLGTALKLNVLSISRDGKTQLAPGPNTQLHGGDQLLVLGRADWLQELVAGQNLILEKGNGRNHEEQELKLNVKNLVSSQISLLELTVHEESPLIGKTLSLCNFRGTYKANVLAIWRGEKPMRTNLQDIPLIAGDRLLIQSSRLQLNRLRASKDFMVKGKDAVKIYQLEERLLLLAIPQGSHLAGKTLAQSELSDAFGLSVLGILRKGKTKLMPKPRERLQEGDQLVVEGRIEDLQLLKAMKELEVESSQIPAISELETEEIGLVEAVVSPHSKLAGKNLRDMQFREKFGLNILAIWRGGRAYRSNLREMPLHHGDSLLIYGNRNRIKMLADEGEFLVLAQEIQEAPRRDKALLAIVIMALVVAGVGLRLVPVEIAAIAGAAAMVLARCLNMEEAQKSIQWPVIFLIAGMLPLGLALQNSGAAAFLGNQVFAQAGSWSTIQLLAVLFLVSNLLAQILPPPVVAVLVSSLILTNAASLPASPQALLLTVAMGSAIPFLTPISHPANLLVMGPGGYRFTDYTKVGLPLTLLIMCISIVAIPYFWP
ncbi:MAG: SLC13 family permease [Chloroflexi bacterium]|nr:SLC13 family permease [Chloroflexota bacterium]